MGNTIGYRTPKEYPSYSPRALPEVIKQDPIEEVDSDDSNYSLLFVTDPGDQIEEENNKSNNQIVKTTEQILVETPDQPEDRIVNSIEEARKIIEVSKPAGTNIYKIKVYNNHPPPQEQPVTFGSYLVVSNIVLTVSTLALLGFVLSKN